MRQSSASGSVAQACVALLRFSPRKPISALRPCRTVGRQGARFVLVLRSRCTTLRSASHRPKNGRSTGAASPSAAPGSRTESRTRSRRRATARAYLRGCRILIDNRSRGRRTSGTTGRSRDAPSSAASGGCRGTLVKAAIERLLRRDRELADARVDRLRTPFISASASSTIVRLARSGCFGGPRCLGST